MKNILIVDDDRAVRFALSEVLKKNSYTPVEVSSGFQALEAVQSREIDLILLDVLMPKMDGIETMQQIRKINPDMPIIVITGHGDIPTAVEATKLGAYDFITKPPQMDRLVLTIRRALESSVLQKTMQRLDSNLDTSIESMFGKSSAIKMAIQQMRQVAWSDFSVIIQGETGTGKSVAAETIHNLSSRANKPFIVVDVGAIPETLVESELFGHGKGAFTGADKSKKGFFEIANSGTLFIDELENIPLTVQAKLLRAVEQKKIYPLGGAKSIDVDIRIIAATNKDIRQLVKERKFREDLFYRMGEFLITIPALKDRADDIPFLAKKFFAAAAIELNKQMREIDEAVLGLLKQYPWPGNVRELKNVIRRAVLLADGDTIKTEYLEFLIDDRTDSPASLPILPLKEISAIASREAETKAIRQVLFSTGGNKTRAASVLEIDYKTLLTKIKEYNIR